MPYEFHQHNHFLQRNIAIVSAKLHEYKTKVMQFIHKKYR